MSNLREQLDSARREHLSSRYTGDLATLLPAPAPVRRTAIRLDRFSERSLIGAAAAVIVACGLVAEMSRRSALSFSMREMLPVPAEMENAPRRVQMAVSVKSLTPTPVASVLVEVRQPLVTSGQVILNIGKDVAHHADALFHMG